VRPGDNGEDLWEGSEPDRPIDIEALRADDELVESLVSGIVRAPREQLPSDDPEAVLRSMLSAWVRDVRPETVGGASDSGATTDAADEDDMVVSGPTVVAAATTGAAAIPFRTRVAGAGRHRTTEPPLYARRLAVAAALVVLVGSTLAVGSYDAQPGGTLWPVTKVLYAERARSVQAAADVSTGLETVRTALKEGRKADAEAAIAAVAATLPQVAPEQGQAQLVQQQQQLAAAVADPEVAASLGLIPPNPVDGGTSPAALAAGAPAPLTDRAAETPRTTTAASTAAPSADPAAPVAPTDPAPASAAPPAVDNGPSEADVPPPAPQPTQDPAPQNPPPTDPALQNPPPQDQPPAAGSTTVDPAPPAAGSGQTAGQQVPAATTDTATTNTGTTNTGTVPADASAATGAPSPDVPAAAAPGPVSQAGTAPPTGTPPTTAGAPTTNAGPTTNAAPPPADRADASTQPQSPGLLKTVTDVVTSVVGAILGS
jgi:hypothetical protein